MKISKIHPDLYREYKDKVIMNIHHSKGTVIGYYIVDDSVILVAQEDEKRIAMDLKQFMEFPTIKIEDFHGDVNKNFFLINQNRIDNGFILSIK
jgi:hypothetical protein